MTLTTVIVRTGHYQAVVWSMAGGLVRNKILAVTFGAEVVGAFGQLSTIAGMLGTIGFVGMWSIAARDLAAEHAAAALRERTSAVLTLGACAGGATAILAIVAAPVILSVTQVEDAGISVWLLGALSAAGTLFDMTTVAWRALDRPGQATMWSLISNIVSTGVMLTAALTASVPLAYGALLCSLAVPAIPFVALVVRWYRAGIVRWAPRRLVAATAVASVPSLLNSLLQAGVDLVMRAEVISVGGLAAAGLFQPLLLLATVLLPSFAAINLSMVAARVGDSDGRRPVSDTVIRGTMLVAGMMVAAAVAAPLAVPLLFSREFAAASLPFAATALAEIPRFAGAAFLVIAFSSNLVRSSLVLVAATCAARVVVFLALFPQIGQIAYPWANLADAVILIGAGVVLTRGRVDRRALSVILALSAASVAAVGVLTAVSIAGAP